MLFYKGDIRRIHSLESLEENFADRSSDVKAPSCEASSNFTQTCEPLDRTDHEHQLIPTIFKRIFPYCSFILFMVQ